MRAGAQRPRLKSLPAAIANTDAGDEVIDFASYFGLELDDWQKWVVRQMCAERADGSWAATQCVLIVPRQNGKSAVLEAIEMAALFLWEEQHVIYSAHLGKTASDHMRRIRRHMDAKPEFRKQGRVLTGKGDERVELWSGAILEFITRGKKSSRGGSPSRIFFDEAMFLTDDQIQAMVPALSAQSMNEDNQAQMIYASSAPIAESEVLHRLRDRGMAGDSDRMFFADWSAEEGCDPADRANWYVSNPGLGIRISEEWIADNELGTMSEQGFGTERLGWPVKLATGSQGAFPPDAWRLCADAAYERSGRVAYAVEVDKDGSAAAIGASDGTGGLVLEWRKGTTWLPGVLAEIVAETPGPVYLDQSGPAGALIAALGAAGVDWLPVSAREHAQACGGLWAAVVEDHSFRHTDQPVLNIAVEQASRRTYGDAWAWDRRRPNVSISPLVAVTLARWAALQTAPTGPVFAY